MTPSETIKEFAQQCCDEIEGHCYTEWSGTDEDQDRWGHSSFNSEKARNLIELYMLRVLADAKPD